MEKVFEAAGLKLIRFANKRSYSIQEIEEKLKPILEPNIKNVETQQTSSQENPLNENPIVSQAQVPICKKCGIPMVLRTVKKGENIGQQFYGCINYPKCTETVKF